MIPEQRRQKIIEKLRESNICTINSLKDEFDVSRVTIQRDVKLLEEKGLITTVHGGFKLKGSFQKFETIFSIRINTNYEKKLEIAKSALNFVRNGDILFLDNSSTTYVFAKELFNLRFSELNIITNSPAIIDEALKSNTGIKVFSTGGELNITWNMLMGNWVTEFLEKVNVDKAFISVGGISIDQMLTTSNQYLADILKVVFRKSQEVNLLLDNTKLLKAGMINIAHLSEVRRVIIDSSYKKNGILDIKNIDGIELIY
jgi:DeoR/GlpR family transcriptional regulator of sugar metabolism